MTPAGKYSIVSELGAGGMGKIYKGVLVGQADFQRPIVIKQLKHGDDQAHITMFVDEARRYAVLDHENIGRIFDFERVNGELCIILEYIDGWSIVEYVERHRERGVFPDLDLSIFIVSRVCRALQYVFEKAKIVHRDISPSNIMMTREGTVKLIDFGIATRSGTRDHSLTGKPAYMAPEMVVELRADNRSDMFSLGAVLYEMLTRERLFGGHTNAEVLEKVISATVHPPQAINPAIPGPVLEILKKALQRDPALRYGSAGEMGGACEHFLYDKGYGPTNLTLKQYLVGLFPETTRSPFRAVDESSIFPRIDPTLIPINDGSSSPHTRPAAKSSPSPSATAPVPELSDLPEITELSENDSGETLVVPSPPPRAKRVKRREKS